MDLTLYLGLLIEISEMGFDGIIVKCEHADILLRSEPAETIQFKNQWKSTVT